jgi:DNA-binding PadR family transcriptional regulator
MEKHGFLTPAESSRDGARPERTVYAITDAGRAELSDWLRELIATPEPSPTTFTAALSVMGALPPDDVIELLGRRIDVLAGQIAARRAELATYDVPRLTRRCAR